MRTEVKVGLFIALFAGVVIAIIQLAKPSNEVVSLDKDKTSYTDSNPRKASDTRTTAAPGAGRTGGSPRTTGSGVATPNSSETTMFGNSAGGTTTPPPRRPDPAPIATPVNSTSTDSNTSGTSTSPGSASGEVAGGAIPGGLSPVSSRPTGSSLGPPSPITNSPGSGDAAAEGSPGGLTVRPTKAVSLPTPVPGGAGSGSTPATGTTTTPPDRKITSGATTGTGGPSGGGSTPPRPAAESGGASTYVIKERDTLTSIARTELGDGNLWTRIKEANPGLNEKRLTVGKSIQIPSRDSLRVATSGSNSGGPSTTGLLTGITSGSADAAENYTVAEGDSLSKIARAKLGSTERWQEIYDLNKDRIPNPDAIAVGTVLKLPPKPKS